MKTLKEILESQNFLVNKKLNNRQDKYEYHPNSKEELKDIIINLLKHGETNLNCIDVSEIDTMDNLFYFINRHVTVKDIDISEWNVSNVTDMCFMFFNCNEFNSDLSKWDVSSVENMEGTFQYCYKFNSDLSRWDVSHVVDMYSTFENCKQFTSNMNNWNISKVVDMRFAFSNCESLRKNNLIPDWYKGKV